MDYEGKEEHFILEEYDIESDAEIQLQLLGKYEKFRSTEIEINDDIFSVGPLKIESDTQEEALERNILSSIPILKFIDEKEIDVLAAENKITWALANQRKLCISVNTVAKKELPFAKHISKFSNPDDETSPKDESMIGI